MPQTPVVNALPVAVILLILPIIVIEAYFAGAEARLWGSFDARLILINEMAVAPDRIQTSLAKGIWTLDWAKTLLLYPFVHISFLQTVFAGMFILALGKFVGGAMGNAAVVIVFFSSAVIGALAYVILLPDTYPLFGAYPSAYGLIGAYTYVLFALAGGVREEQMRAFQLIGMLMAINLVFTLISGGPNVWMAELVGAVTGFLASAALRPGGIPHLLETLRRR